MPSHSARLAPLTLLAGAAAGVGAVALHQRWWGLALAVVTSLVLLVAAPAGWTRLTFAVGFTGVVGLLTVPRGEGDYLVGATASGYTLLVVALVVLVVALATLPRPGGAGDRRNRRPTDDAPARE